MIRLAHLSDIHVDSAMPDWALADWFSKRLTSWLNLRLSGRTRRFACAAEVLTCLMDELPGRAIDHVVFSGDATALGFASEFRRAAELLRVETSGIPGLAVPGNHDYCTRAAAASGDFERFFARWQEGQRIGAHRYPFAQRAGPVWLIGVNAATGNRIPWDAGGTVGPSQLERLKQLLEDLGAECKILVIHYPLRLSDGKRETRQHGLRDLDALLAVARAGGVSLWLHGHRHSPYFLPAAPDASFPVICAGATTQEGIWSYGEYTITGAALEAVRRVYDPSERCFRDAERFALTLGMAAPQPR